VITRSATLADAASTALFIAGPKWPEIASAMGVKYVLFIDDQGYAEATPQMLKRLKQVDPTLKIQSRSLP
jgi:thiamine biosynthesis lipoprotein ApbE